jgi:hypothetical protein
MIFFRCSLFHHHPNLFKWMVWLVFRLQVPFVVAVPLQSQPARAPVLNGV